LSSQVNGCLGWLVTANTHGVRATDTPDSTSSFFCNNTQLVLGATTWCFITPRKAGTVIFSLNESFRPLQYAQGSASPVVERFGNLLSFNFTAGRSASFTGPLAISDGLSAALVTLFISGEWPPPSRRSRPLPPC
jgi:hypothetical protein